jgi:hypothetical protein
MDFEAMALDLWLNVRLDMPLNKSPADAQGKIADALRTAYAAGRAGGIEEAAKAADEEADAMLAQREDAISGTFGGRKISTEVSRRIASDRRSLAEGYIGLAASIRALAGKEGE